MTAGDVKRDAETGEQNRQHDEHPEVPGFESFQRPRERHQPEQGRHNNHRVHAGPLPVTAAQMQPHAEFVEGQAHGHAVRQRGDFCRPAGGPPEDAVAAHDRQQEDAIIQMMNVGAVHEQVEVRHLLRHDEQDKNPRQDERHDEAEQGPARQPVCRFASNVRFRCRHGIAPLWFWILCSHPGWQSLDFSGTATITKFTFASKQGGMDASEGGRTIPVSRSVGEIACRGFWGVGSILGRVRDDFGQLAG